MAKGRKILIVDHDRDLLHLFDLLLRTAGYDTASVPMDAAVMEEVRRFDPDAILADLISGHQDDLELLDQLRTDPVTQGTPVVAMSTAPDILGQAVASYNVRQVLLKPFDVEDLEEKVRAALEGSPLLALLKGPRPPVRPLFSEVALGLAAGARAMIIRWVQCLASTEPFRSRKLDLSGMIDQIPTLLGAVLVALLSEDFRAELAQHPEIRAEVVEHVRLRRKQGIPLDAIVMEYQFLRDEIRCEIAGILKDKAVKPEEVLEVVTRKDYALDTIVRFSVETYKQEEKRP